MGAQDCCGDAVQVPITWRWLVQEEQRPLPSLPFPFVVSQGCRKTVLQTGEGTMSSFRGIATKS